MIKIVVGQNMMKKTVEADETVATVRSVLEDAGMDPNATFHLDGDVVTADMMGKTFLELGRMDSAATYFLSSVTKADSAC